MNDLKKYFILLIIFICTFLQSCIGAVRFTSKEKEIKSERKIENVTENKEEINLTNNSSEALETIVGTASYYGKKFNGRKTANGEIFDMNDLTAAHGSYPFNTLIKVTNLNNEKSVVVRVNDRKPEFKNRIIDLSYGAAKELDMIGKGLAKVKLEVISFGTSVIR
jgi:rare lipoprotein A (peptidoglycan hydrolase)